MTRFNKALLASASFAILASAAQAQVVTPITPASPLLPILPPGGVYQKIDSTFASLLVGNLVPGFAISETNIAGAVGPVKASSEVFQIAANTLNQFGSSGSAVFVLGDYSVTQAFAFGTRDNILALNANGAYSSGGLSTVKGSQVIATGINNMAVDNGKGGQNFTVAQTYAPDQAAYTGFGNTGTVTGQQNVLQQNSMVAGYNVPGGAVGTGGSEIIGEKLPGTTGTSTTGLQANTFSINTASVNVVPPLLGPYTSEDLKLYQSALVNGDIVLSNFADAGVQNSSTPPRPNTPPIDPSISNLQQIAVVTINSATLTGDPKAFTKTPASFDLAAAFKSQTGTTRLAQTPNQFFAGAGGFLIEGADISLYNVAHAVTWSNGSYTGPGVEWTSAKAGAGDVSIGGAVDEYGNGGVKQIVALSINTVSGPTSQDGKAANEVNVAAGTYEPNLGSITTPPGTSAFWQYADLNNLDLGGRPDTLPGAAFGGAGIRNSFVDTLVTSSSFPSTNTFVPVSPTSFDWDTAQNTAIAGTAFGEAKIWNLDQVTAVTVNSFSFDNSVTDKTTGKITSSNTDEVSGRIAQDAILSSSLIPNSFDLANVAVASTGAGVAKLDTVNQTNVFGVNSFTAGTADFSNAPKVPGVADQTNGLTQTVSTGRAVLNLGNLASVSGTIASATDVKQINAVSLNSGTIGTTLGGGISQTVSGGLNVNAGNYLSATGVATASIVNAAQTSVVSVNSISGYAH